MATCPYCKEDIRHDAIKCRYCSSVLPDPAAARPDADRQVTYVLDSDLIRYVKVAGSMLTLFLIVGAFLWGFDLKNASREVEDARSKTLEDREKIVTNVAEVNTLKAEVARLHDDVLRVTAEAKTLVAEITQSREQVGGIVASMMLQASANFGEERALQLIKASLLRYLTPVLPPDQLSALNKHLESPDVIKKYTREELAPLIRADIEHAARYLREHGLAAAAIGFEITRDEDFANAYWDGTKLVFGMGMVNSDLFGPYDSSIVFHECTHSLIDLTWRGESASVTEHLCDVMAIIVRGTDWTIGSVRARNGIGLAQTLRSLEAPGTAYDLPSIGKDPQVSHMKDFVADAPDDGMVNGSFHLNSGILNKAAYLMSEGGTHGQVTVTRGIGRDKLGVLYIETIKQLPSDTYLSFAKFRDLVVQVANTVLGDNDDAEVVRDSFRAVGL